MHMEHQGHLGPCPTGVTPLLRQLSPPYPVLLRGRLCTIE